jgi:hypothetical protein
MSPESHLGFVEDFFDPWDFALLRGGEESDLVLGVGREDLGYGAELRGEVRVDEKESHGRSRRRLRGMSEG